LRIQFFYYVIVQLHNKKMDGIKLIYCIAVNSIFLLCNCTIT